MDDPERHPGAGQDSTGAQIAEELASFTSLVGELYRGEVDRTTTWRARLDQTTNWAVVFVAAILTWAFSSPDHPHFVILIGVFGVSAFLVMEATRYREYDVWRGRVRTLQTELMAEAREGDSRGPTTSGAVTAIGMTEHIEVMVVAMVIAIACMMLAAEPMGDFVSRHPTVKMLALSFLLTALAICGGLTLGILLAVARQSRSLALQAVSTVYVNAFRSVPLLLVIFWFYFLVPIVIDRSVGAFYSALIAFALFEAAYYSEIIRAGLQSVSRGQVQAGLALGLTRRQNFQYVVLPQALRNMVPVLITQAIILFQDTSLVYVVSLQDFMTSSDIVAKREGRSAWTTSRSPTTSCRSRSARAGWWRCTSSRPWSTSRSVSPDRSS